MHHVALVAALLISVDLYADSDSLTRYFFEPHPIPAGRIVANLGLSMTLLPEPLVEQEVPTPAVSLQAKLGLTPWASAYGSLATNYLSNILVAGVQWNVGDRDLSFALGNGLSLFVGFFNMRDEFDNNSVAALADAPMIRIAHRFGDVAASLSISGSYVLYADTHIGSIEDKRISLTFNDVSFTLACEQPFFGSTNVSTGIRVTYSRTPYQIWMMYNAFDQYLVLQDFFFEFQL